MEISLDNYKLTECLYDGVRTQVYRAHAIIEQKSVIIKFLKTEYPSFSQLLQFRNQYTITKNLNLPGIIQSYKLEPYRNSYALVMEDFGGVALHHYSRTQNQAGKLPLPEVLNIALELAEILHQLHSHRVIHKDIKPANILIHPQTKQIKLIDFSIASLLPKETQEIQNPNVLEGTLAYIAPEQTGRMNRAIDYRSDFYSLGVTLYELLTGKLPFNSIDPLELVHCHIAQTPIPPHQLNSQIPPIVSQIILKLMAKNVEERYQTALGLKYDIEKCAKQWEATGKISQFELGTRDLCDRFIIPEKLYGREQEVAQLLAAFERVADGTSEMMLVAGFSGIGKTAVINEVHKPITRQKGYFIKGKFDQFNRNIPLSAFVQAFRDLIGQLLADSDEQHARWRSQILEAVGDNARVLIEVIPELESIIGEQPPVPELAGMAAQNRFNLVFQKFIEVFTRPEHPLVIFLDDLQWVDLGSLQLITLLMQDRNYLLLLGAYRDNEVFPAHPLMLAIEELKQAGKTLNTITLAPLPPSETNRLVADTLHCPPQNARPLSELVDSKTKGNPFFITQFLKALCEEQHITFNRDYGYWECDIANLKTLVISDDIVEFMGGQLQKLSPETRESLKFAACIGNQFDLTTLAIILEKNEAEIATSLWEGLQEGLILPQSEIYKFYASLEQTETQSSLAQNASYRFLHDRVQQAAYSLIIEAERERTHYRIGQLLLEKIPPEQREERIFEIVSQLNYGKNFIEEQSERDHLAQLNLIACHRAKAATAYNASRDYANIGLSLLGKNAWEQQYELCLIFHDLAAEMASFCGDFESMERLNEKVIECTHSLSEKVNVYCLKIQVYIAQSQFSQALALARSLLQQFGLNLPETPTPEEIQRDMVDIAQLIGNREIEELVDLPIMKDAEKLSIVRVVNSALSAAIISGSPSYPLLVALAVKLSIEYGNIPISASAYANYGLILCSFFKQIEIGIKFGNLALNLVEKAENREIKSRVQVSVASNIYHRKNPIKETIYLMQEAYKTGLNVGDMQFAGYAISIFISHSLSSGKNLIDIDKKARDYYEQYRLSPMLGSRESCEIYWQFVQNLLGKADKTTVLTGEILDETKAFHEFVERGDSLSIYNLKFYALILGYLFNDLELARSKADEIRPYLLAMSGNVAEAGFYFYDSLVALIDLDGYSLADSKELERVEKNQTELKQFWANHAPMNYQHKVDLVEAEKCRVLGQKLEGIELYDKAIAGAKENEYIQEEALANELAAKFYLGWGKTNVAAGYMQEAYYAYSRWGAKAKTDDLEKCYPHLLGPILHSASTTVNILDTFTTLTSSSSYTFSHTVPSSSSSSSLNNALDFATVLKAAQSISSSLQIEELLTQLTAIILQNSGADRCALILSHPDGSLYINALATLESHQLTAHRLQESKEVPVKLIQYIKNIRQVIVIDSLKTKLPIIDEYLEENRPESVLGAPIIDRGNLVGILYLENRQTQGVFTQDRLVILNFLCTQAAISLQNARLYQQAQDYAQQAQNYAQQLEQSQLQIVQSEKMASLGNLVAGVAHEINNPIGFLNGSVNNAKDFLSDLLEHLEIYQQSIPNPPEAVTEHAEDIDLEFTRGDFLKLLDSMQGAIDRIKGISTSLRTFSRADSDNKVSANLHEGLDSTLLILKYRLKANEHRPAIEIIKDYGQIPEIKCFAGQLNQVFMNIIANAIDALDEVAQQSSYKELEAKGQHIKVQTGLNEAKNAVEIRIIDNGGGIPEVLVSKIFEHLFTTKGVGKGTGLGLAIARQIVKEKHGGEIEVHSELGQGTEFCISLPVND